MSWYFDLIKKLVFSVITINSAIYSPILKSSLVANLEIDEAKRLNFNWFSFNLVFNFGLFNSDLQFSFSKKFIEAKHYAFIILINISLG